MSEGMPNNPEKKEVFQYPDVATRLLAMKDVDQAMRHSEEWDEQVDAQNTETMKALIAEIGWPTKSKVGKEASEAAWLLVQHADHDPAFQEQCLALMKEQDEGEVSLRDMAYLEDRIRVNTGRPTVYGTQFQETRDEETRQTVIAYGPQPIEDMGGLDERRAAAGMEPFEEYRRELTHHYYPHLIEDENGVTLSAEIERSIETLEKERAVSIDMRLSPKEREILERVRIEQELDQFDSFGGDFSATKELLFKYLQQMGENDDRDVEEIANIVTRLSEGMRQGFKEESVWTMVRVTLPNSEFEIPRWNPDGKYFKSTKKHYKLVGTLKGAQTRFGDAIDPEAVERLQKEESENYDTHEHGLEEFKQEDRRIREELVRAVEVKEIGGEGKAVIYLVGEDDAVLYSESNITEPRIFVSVLAGSEEQITEWRSKLER